MYRSRPCLRLLPTDSGVAVATKLSCWCELIQSTHRADFLIGREALIYLHCVYNNIQIHINREKYPEIKSLDIFILQIIY
jgi:hypothetical protein